MFFVRRDRNGVDRDIANLNRHTRRNRDEPALMVGERFFSDEEVDVLGGPRITVRADGEPSHEGMPYPHACKTWLSLGGLALSAFLVHRRSPLAFLAGIFAVTLTAGLLGWVAWPQRPLQVPDFSSVLLKLDPVGALKLFYLPTIIAILFTDLFDSLSTFVGVSEATGLVDEKGEPLRLKEGLMVDAWATLGAGEETLPPFLIVVLIPLTFSITQGMLWGFISHVLLFALAGRRREVHPVMWSIAAISLGLLVLEQGFGNR